MFEGTGTCRYFGYLFSRKCGIIGISFLKYAQKYGYHLKKHGELWVPFWYPLVNIAKLFGGKFNISKMDVQLEMKLK